MYYLMIVYDKRNHVSKWFSSALFQLILSSNYHILKELKKQGL